MMPTVYTDKSQYSLGEDVLVHYDGFPSNTQLGIAWITVDGKIYNYPHVGAFNSGNGSGVVKITTSQGGKQLTPGRYRIKVWVWDNPSVCAETSNIYVGTSPTPTPTPTPTPPPSQPSSTVPLWAIGLALGIPIALLGAFFALKK